MHSTAPSDGGALSQQVELFDTHVLYLVGTTISLYDHVMTFSDEYTRVWRAPLSLASACFLLVRYISVLTGMSLIYAAFGRSQWPIERCSNYILFRQIALAAIQALVAVIQFLRIYALYSHSKRIAALFIVAGLGTLAAAAWTATREIHSASFNDRCAHITPSSNESGIQIAGLWEAVLVYDTMIFFLTIFKTHQGWLKYRATERLDIISLMHRDLGVIFFGTIIVAHGANVATFYLFPVSSKGILTTVASSVSVAMVSRLTLNLWKLGAPAARTLLPCSYESTRLEFTTRISLSQGEGDTVGGADQEASGFHQA